MYGILQIAMKIAFAAPMIRASIKLCDIYVTRIVSQRRIKSKNTILAFSGSTLKINFLTPIRTFLTSSSKYTARISAITVEIIFFPVFAAIDSALFAASLTYSEIAVITF